MARLTDQAPDAVQPAGLPVADGQPADGQPAGGQASTRQASDGQAGDGQRRSGPGPGGRGPLLAGQLSRAVRLRLARDPLTATAALLVLLAACWAAWSGWSWLRAAHSARLAAATARDAVLQAAEQGAQNFGTLDYRHLSAGLDRWLASSTGHLHASIEQGRAQFASDIRQSQTITTARVLEAAVTALNIRAGTASVIIAERITVIPRHGQPAVKQLSLAGQLTRTAGGWKLSGLGQIPVQAAGQSPAP